VPMPSAGPQATPVQLWTRLKACTDLVDAVVRRHATLDRVGWEQLAGQIMDAATQCRILAEVAQPPMETRSGNG